MRGRRRRSRRWWRTRFEAVASPSSSFLRFFLFFVFPRLVIRSLPSPIQTKYTSQQPLSLSLYSQYFSLILLSKNAHSYLARWTSSFSFRLRSLASLR